MAAAAGVAPSRGEGYAFELCHVRVCCSCLREKPVRPGGHSLVDGLRVLRPDWIRVQSIQSVVGMAISQSPVVLVVAVGPPSTKAPYPGAPQLVHRADEHRRRPVRAPSLRRNYGSGCLRATQAPAARSQGWATAIRTSSRLKPRDAMKHESDK